MKAQTNKQTLTLNHSTHSRDHKTQMGCIICPKENKLKQTQKAIVDHRDWISWNRNQNGIENSKLDKITEENKDIWDKRNSALPTKRHTKSDKVDILDIYFKTGKWEMVNGQSANSNNNIF